MEVSSSIEHGRESQVSPLGMKCQSGLDMRDQPIKNVDIGDMVPEIEEAIAREMWEAI